MKHLTLSTILPDWNFSLRTMVLLVLVLAFASTTMADSQKLASQAEETVIKQAPQQSVVYVAPTDSFQLDQFSINAAGAIDNSSANFTLGLSLGQPVVGTTSSASYLIGTGFWYESCLAEPGDANDDGLVNLGDAVYLLNYLFKGGLPPAPNGAGDTNDDGVVNLGDVVYLLNYLFKGGPPPTC
jgi:hypothetical protein